mgnify:CR=1 FL=1
MAKREVTVEIKVKDDEVKHAEKSLNRLDKAASGVGTTGAKDLKEFENASSSASKQAAYFGDVIGSVVGYALTGLTVIIAGTVLAIYQLSQGIFTLAKGFADYAKEIDHARQRTGLSIETLSGLKGAVESVGGSFDLVQDGLSDFQKKIGEAASGSKKATAELNRLGVDPVKAINNLDGAFRTALKTINSLPPGVQQTNAAIDAFGENGAKLLPFLTKFNGDVDAMIAKARELGVVLSEEDVRAATEFNNSLAEVQTMIRGVMYTFGREYLPEVKRVLDGVNALLLQNKGETRSWAEDSASFIHRVITIMVLFADGIDRIIAGTHSLNTGWTGLLGRWVSSLPTIQLIAFLMEKMANSASVITQKGRAEQAALGVSASLGVTAPGTNYFAGSGGGGGRRGGGAKAKLSPIEELEKRRNEAQSAFDLFSGSPYAQQLVLETSKINDQKSKLEELLKLRDRLGVNQGFALPGSLKELTEELDAIKKQESGLKTAETMLEGFKNELAGIGKEQTNLEKVNNLLKDEDRNLFIDETTKALLREKAVLVDWKKAAEEYEKAMQEIVNGGEITRIDLGANIEAVQEEIRLGRDLTGVERQQIDNKAELIKKEIEWRAAKKTDEEIEGLKGLLSNEQQLTLEYIKRLEAAKTFQAARNDFKAFNQSLEDQFDEVRRGNRPMTVYEETLRKISRNTHEWTDAEQEQNLVLAAQIDAVIELNKRHAELKDFFSETLSYAFEGDFSGLLENFQRRITGTFIDSISQFLATEILGFDPNQTDNPVAKPIVGKLDKTNQLLNLILTRLGGGSGGGSLGSLTSILTGGGLSGGFGSGGGFGGTPSFGGGSGLPTVRLPNGEEAIQVDGRSIIQRITGPGGVFGSQGFGNNVGTFGAIGSIGNLVGGAVGGRVGGIISSTASGLALGASIGSIIPGIGTAIGAAIGAIGGFLFGIFQGDPKKKKDKNENLPNLAKGFTEAFSQLNEILTDMRALRIDPDEAIKRAGDVRAQIAGGFGIKFESSKYKKVAQQQIQSNLVQADSIIEQIKASAEIARGAADRSKRILPEFAGGTYFADYFKPNGLLPGMFDGKDNILAMISRGEMVLNPTQQNRVRALAGADVFAGAGIPNYPRASSTPKMAIGGIAGAGLQLISQQQPTVVVQPQFTMYVEGMTFDERSKAWIQSDGGKRTLVKIIKQEKKADRSL